MTIPKKRKKLNKLSQSATKFKIKANKSTINFKSKKRLKKLTDDTSSDSDEESESDDVEKKGKKSKKNKKKGNKRSISNYKNRNNFNNTKRSRSVKSFKSSNKNKMLRKNRSEVKKKNNKLFNRTIQSEKSTLKRKKNILNFKNRSKTPNTSRYGNNSFKNNKNKFLRTDNTSSAFSRRFKNIKRQSFDQINKKYRLFTELDERNKKNYMFGTNNKRRDSEDGLTLNFRASKYTQNISNYFKIGSRRFNFGIYSQKEKEDGFYNRITLYPKIEEDKFHERKYLQGDANNPYSVKWPSHFLEIGYNSGFYYENYQDGVPILRLKKLKNKVTLPPINSRYSQASERPIEVPPLNFNNLTRQERINYIITTEENNNENNVFRSFEARKKLLEKFNPKNKKNNEQ